MLWVSVIDDAALAFAHPTPEFVEAIASGAYGDALGDAWGAVTGRGRARVETGADFARYEAGYIAAFLHGPTGKPVASLLAGDHERLLAGLSRPVMMLNIAEFYRAFGLKAAVEDEGKTDEPDHIAAMAEFMAVLCHLEAKAITRPTDPSAPRRAQRDFLARFLAPMLEEVDAGLRGRCPEELDPVLAGLVQDLGPFARQQIAELEAVVGPYHDPDAPSPERSGAAPQNLWG